MQATRERVRRGPEEGEEGGKTGAVLHEEREPRPNLWLVPNGVELGGGGQCTRDTWEKVELSRMSDSISTAFGTSCLRTLA